VKHLHRVAVATGIAGVLASSCTALREIPREDFASRPERRNIRVETREGLVYDFDFVRVHGDSLIGFRRLEVESPFDEFGQLGFATDDIQRLSARGIDWKRTGLVGGGVIAAVVAAGLTTRSSDDGGSGDGGPGRVP
jgi:hypothetical protein